MFRRRLVHVAFLVMVGFSVVAGSFVGRVAVEQAVAQSQLKSGSTTSGNPLKQLQDAGGKAYTGGKQTTPKDLRYIVSNVVKMALQLVGLIMLCLMLYAGYLWMTAGGDDGKVSEAKTVIRNAVIGMILVGMSYTLVTFVFRSVYVVQDNPESRPCSGFIDAINPFGSCT